MRRLIVSFAALAATAAATGAQAASVEIRDAVARVVVSPESRADVVVEVLTRNGRLPLEVRQAGDRVVVDGGLSRRIMNCSSRGGRTRVHVRGVGEVAYADMPQILIRTPRQVEVAADGAVFGEVGRAASVDLSNAGCGDWLLANVAGRMSIRQVGSGDTRAGAAGEADLQVAGSGDIVTRAIDGRLAIKVAGSGDVLVERVTGPMTVQVAGSGDVKVLSGQASAMDVTIAGSGDVDFGGDAASLSAKVMGSGDVRARAVRGQVTKTVMGSGDVIVGR
ncbi:GIN domain-containing protein [Phenylobacterium terrae]|uniref:GIN domain-containing protein n=1 Tax=Phenylobacterium terrae TaxID=2665495 RepID=A0ABW4N310_9CAUL